MRFLRLFIQPEVTSRPPKERRRLMELMRTNFHYRTFDDSNYSAVVSDDTIIFMPVLNTDKFRVEAPWLEIVRTIHKREYQNFSSDIERLIEHESKTVRLETMFK
jgi:hypothetical protein